MQTIITGEVSSGTLREEDLIPRFLDVLDECAPERADAIRTNYADALAHLEIGLEPGGQEDLAWLMHDLDDALMACAPTGHYWGTLEGDGACFGFWPVW